MKELYRIIIEFKALHPLRFWVIIFIVTSLFILMVWKLLKKKRSFKSKIPTSSTVKVEQEVVGQKLDKETSHFDKTEVKKYNEKIVENITEVSEPEIIYKKPEVVKQDKTTPKRSEIENKNNSVPQEQLPEIKKEKNKSTEAKIVTKTSEVISQPKSKEQLPKAKIETAKSKDEVLFVNYELLRVQTTNLYPILRFPKKGTVVRSYRLGNTKRRGYKEEPFQNSIKQYFGKDFIVLGNARLNTGKETRPFEPDIAIIDKFNLTNLRIDIEIDEPYAGITRQPTHCKGDDVNRDIYFIDRGWIVIRFSEYQVHFFENECLHFIAVIIKAANSKYIVAQFESITSLQSENLWDIVQAQKWEKAKYRENYLNHTFVSVEEKPETIERDFDEQEFKEEELVKPTLIGLVDNKKSLSFNLKNAHSRDSRIKFYPKPHTYTIDNTPAPSASTIISKFFPEFDTVYWASRKAPELGMTPNQVEIMWRTKGEKAAQDGTFLHEQIEKFYLEQEYERTEEFHLFENFGNENSHIKP